MSLCTVIIGNIDRSFIPDLTKRPDSPSGILQAYYDGWGFDLEEKKLEFFYYKVPHDEALVAQEALKTTHPEFTFSIN